MTFEEPVPLNAHLINHFESGDFHPVTFIQKVH